MTSPTDAPASRDESKRETVRGVLPKPKPDFEVGVSSHLPFVTPFKEGWEALREDEVTVRQLQMMRRTDGQARALYRLIALPIRAALKTATFLPQDNIEGGEDEAKFIENMFTLPPSAGGMQTPFGRFIAQVLSAVFEGFTAHELVYWQPKSGPLKGKWTLKKLAHRPSDQLTFILDSKGEWRGLRQQTVFLGEQIDREIPADHAIYYAANEEERPYYGVSYFETAFKHWDKKFRLYAVAHIAAQRAAVGTRIGKMPVNPAKEDVENFKRALRDVGVAQYMTMSEDYSIESLKESGGFEFLSFINHHNSQMSKSVLAAFFDDQQGSGGDASLVDFGRQSDALFMMMLQTIMSEIEEVINNKVIPRFIDWNFGSGKYPRFQFGSLTEETKSKLIDLFKILAVAGQSLTVRPEMVHELSKQISEEIGLEVDWDAVETEMEEEKQKAALMEQQPELMGDGSPGPGGELGTPGVPTDAATPDQLAPAAGPKPQISPDVVPPGFVLSRPSESAFVELTDYAADLLDEALIELVRGKPRSGGPKYVRTQEGAKTYGVPVGTPITRDMDRKLGSYGDQGAPYGGRVKKSEKNTKADRETHGGGKGAKAQNPGQQLGGGTGAKAQNPGQVNNDERGENTTPQRILSNPREPGAQLLDYGDGTVAVRDAKGRLSARQRFNVELFLKYGWKVDSAAGSKPKPEKPDDEDK